MAQPPRPKHVTLGPPGPYELPEAKGQPNLAIPPEDSQRERLVFPLEDKTELHLPVRDNVLRKLYETLKKRFD
jgi:hypothetical protein